MEELSLKEKESLAALTEPLSLEEFMKKTNLKHFEAMQIIKFLLHSRYIHRTEGFPTKYAVERFLLKKVKLLQKRLDMSSLQSNACDAVLPLQTTQDLQKQ
ncbi:MAG: hypothetical protein Q7S21_04545 [archaeon]|nr:hypothetical protein [archaeon]